MNRGLRSSFNTGARDHRRCPNELSGFNTEVTEIRGMGNVGARECDSHYSAFDRLSAISLKSSFGPFFRSLYPASSYGFSFSSHIFSSSAMSSR